VIALDAVDKGCDEAFARASDLWLEVIGGSFANHGIEIVNEHAPALALAPLFDCGNHHGTRFAMIVSGRAAPNA